MVVRDMRLTVDAQYGAVSVYHCYAVVQHVAVLLVEAYRQRHGKLPRDLPEALYGGVLLQR